MKVSLGVCYSLYLEGGSKWGPHFPLLYIKQLAKIMTYTIFGWAKKVLLSKNNSKKHIYYDRGTNRFLLVFFIHYV